MLNARQALKLSARSAKPLPRVPAFADLYDKFDWNPRHGEMIMVAGRPGSQKSGVALNWAASMNLNTLYFSADMSSFQASSRLAGIKAGHTADQVEHIMRGAPEDADALLRQLDDFKITFSFETPIKGRSIEAELDAYVELWDEYPELIVFDNLMDFEGADSDYSAQQETMQALDEMKRELRTTILLLHHATDKGASAKEDPSLPPPRGEIKNGLGEKPEAVITVALTPDGSCLNACVVKNRTGKSDPSGRDFVRIGARPESTRFFKL